MMSTLAMMMMMMVMMVMMVMVVMMVAVAVTARHDDDAGPITAIVVPAILAVVMVMVILAVVMVMVMVVMIKLSQLDVVVRRRDRRRFIDGLQQRRGVRDRLQQVGEGIGPQHVGRRRTWIRRSLGATKRAERRHRSQ